jgi:hypothetical protein
MEPTELILLWRFRIHRMRLSHYETALVFGHRHLWLGLPVIVLSTVVGTSVFATIQKCAQTDNVPWVQILVGLLSVLRGGSSQLTDVRAFFRARRRAPNFMKYGSKCLMSSLFLFGMLIQFCKVTSVTTVAFATSNLRL